MSLLERLQKERTVEASDSGKPNKARSVQVLKEDPFEELKGRIHMRSSKRSTPTGRAAEMEGRTGIRNRRFRISENYLDDEGVSYKLANIVDCGDNRRNDRIRSDQPAIRDPSISEIMVNGPQNVYVEKKGRLVLTDVVFKDDQHVSGVIENRCTAGEKDRRKPPMVDAGFLTVQESMR